MMNIFCEKASQMKPGYLGKSNLFYSTHSNSWKHYLQASGYKLPVSEAGGFWYLWKTLVGVFFQLNEWKQRFFWIFVFIGSC